MNSPRIKYTEIVIGSAGAVEVGDGVTVGELVGVVDAVAVAVTVAVGAGFDPLHAANETAAITTAIITNVQRVLCGEVMAPHFPFAD
jgi:hypothetical protein